MEEAGLRQEQEAGPQLHLPKEALDMSEEGDTGMLVIEPSLSYIYQILMEEEGEDDGMPVDNSSYRSTFSGFYEILAGNHSQPSPCVDSICSDKASDAGRTVEQYAMVVNPSADLDNMPHEPCSFGVSGEFLHTTRHSPPHETAEVGFTPKHHSGFQGHSAQFPALQETRNVVSASGSCLNSSGLNEASVPLNDGMLVSCWGKDAAGAEGLGDKRHMQQQQQGEEIFKVPLPDEELSLKLADVELSFEYMKLDNVYSDLYASSTGVSGESRQSGDETTFPAGEGRKARKTGRLELGVFVDVKEVLVHCAQAVAIGDAKMANGILQELRQVHGASANGSSLQRIAHFFGKALEARMRGTGEHLFRAMSCMMPSAVNLLQATKAGYERMPFLKIMHYYANQSILKVAEGASRLHVVDFGLIYGIQWPCLISALASCKGSPPMLILTGIELPQTGVNPGKRLEKSGRQLASYAKTYNVPFQYHAIVSSKWEDLDTASLNLHEDEVLVVNCIKCLRHFADESVNLASTTCPRQKLLTFMRSLNPHLLLTAVTNTTYNVPFFVSRFREALHHFSNLFDLYEALWGDDPQRHVLERSCFYNEILNIVGCEGAERVERPETYKQWHARITKAGFEQLPILSEIVSRSRAHVKQHYHRDFLVHHDGKGWMLMGWKGRTVHGVSAWKPRIV